MRFEECRGQVTQYYTKHTTNVWHSYTRRYAISCIHVHIHNDCVPVYICGGYYYIHVHVTPRHLNHIDLSTLQIAFAYSIT